MVYCQLKIMVLWLNDMEVARIPDQMEIEVEYLVIMRCWIY